MARKALLIGINDYAPVGAGGPDLRGCVNDVKDMATTLNAMGIIPPTPLNMRILTNSRATKANILSGLQWLVKGARKGDVLIFHYSGHGSQVVDTSGDEIDGKDETICPHDYASAGMIKDDDFRSIFKTLSAGVNLDVFLDSCHSGTGTRERILNAAAPEELACTARYVDPPLDYGFFIETNPQLSKRGILKPAIGERQVVLVPGLNHVLWAGCRDNQTSAEASIGGVVRGIFTYAFCKTLRAAGPAISRAKLDSLVSSYIAKMGYSQIPQLEGTSDSMGEKVFT